MTVIDNVIIIFGSFSGGSVVPIHSFRRKRRPNDFSQVWSITVQRVQGQDQEWAYPVAIHLREQRHVLSGRKLCWNESNHRFRTQRFIILNVYIYIYHIVFLFSWHSPCQSSFTKKEFNITTSISSYPPWKRELYYHPPVLFRINEQQSECIN